LIFLWS